ncbi:hypothetical protein [Neoroseomonas rubea]|uniref:hypothetical protein n=1 Tax=Neoroseomonas rubea TaxID=2748666 RepID=UPI0018E01193|nr:hypothetical protein [Roseomonas rubea]
MSCAKHAADALDQGSDDRDGASQAAHLALASMAVEGILLSAYEHRHDEAARVLAEILSRLKEAAGAMVRR